MPTPPKPLRGRPPLLDPRQLIHARIAAITRRKLEAECRRGALNLGRLIDRLALALPDA
jgi:hypothetical protein